MAIDDIRLNLFKVFDAVMQTRSVTEAAKILNMKRDAVQHALGRLREALDDELFIYHGGVMAPTRLAKEISASVTGISDELSKLATALTTKDFVPTKAVRTFRIAAGDYFISTIFPRVIASVLSVAPGIKFEFFPCNRLDVINELEDGHLDFAMGWFGKLPDRLTRRVILIEEEALVVRTGHPLLERVVTIDRLLSYPRIVVDLSGSEEVSKNGFHLERGVLRRVWIDRFLIDSTPGDVGTIGHVAVSVPYFNAVIPLVAASDMVATLPKRLAVEGAHKGQVVLLIPPYEPLQIGLQAIYCKNQDNDQGLKWLFGEIAATVENLAK